jgi:biopolymer transport protein ExbB
MRQRAWWETHGTTFGWRTCGWQTGILLTVLSVWAIGMPGTAAARAQEADDADVFADEELPDAEPAAPAAAPAPAARESELTEEPVERSYLQIAFRALGWYTLIFLGLSFSFVALLVMNLLTARRENLCPPTLIEGFEGFLNEKQYQEAYELAKNDDSFLGQVLSAGLAKLSSGYAQAIEAMQEVGEEENMKLDHRLSYMALIGTISPMVGLFGTVHGMILSFQEIAIRSSTPPPSVLAEGISTALFTTLVGLAIAIPAIAAYNILKNRIARLVLEVGIVSEGLMARFENVGPRKK